ncbi:MAG: AMP-binding protein [Magnetococcales bacterium]|nr:AMP-binding protein [Magnetococcales bacterium]
MQGWRRTLTAWLVTRRMRVSGIDGLRAVAGGWVAVANHDHPLDWLLVAPFLPDDTLVALHPVEMPSPRLARWCSWLRFVSHDPLDPATLKPLVRHLKQGGHLFVFPSGGGFGDGAVGRVLPGVAHLPELAGVPVIPLWLHNTAWWRGGRIRPPLELTVSRPRMLTLGPGRERHRSAELAMTDCLEEAGLLARGQPSTLWEAARRIVAHQGRSTPIIADSSGMRFTYGQWLARSVILGRVLARRSAPGERVGVLLPTTAGSLVVFFALLAIGRVPAMLNFTAGAATVRSACRTARIRTVLTSRRFVDKAGLTSLIAELSAETAVVCVEDLAPEARRPWNLLAGTLASFFPARLAVSPESEAVILFTSGTEGEPKGVALSHGALLANIRQVQLRVGLLCEPGRDCMLDVLPLFHAFGLTVAALAPIFSGVRLYLHPSPLDYRAIAEIAQRIRPTLLVGTDTFLSGYGRVAHPVDFRSLRLVFAGGEPLRERTRRQWLDRFGVAIFQGYGTTECGPALSVDTPLLHAPESVGRPLAGVRCHLEAVPGMHAGFRLLVSGPNLMLGYIPPGGDGRVVPVSAPGPGAGWHDVGDVVTVDAEGFWHIVGRLKRFAKIGGEMVSLAAVEALAETVWPDARHAAVALPDSRKGERILLVTEQRSPDRADLMAIARRDGVSGLFVPAFLWSVETLPLLGPGKIDHQAVRALAETAWPGLES